MIDTKVDLPWASPEQHPPLIPPPRPIRRELSRAIRVLRCSSPSVFGVESTGIFGSNEWGPAKESMGQATRRVLPTDQVMFCVRLARCRHSAQSCSWPGHLHVEISEELIGWGSSACSAKPHIRLAEVAGTHTCTILTTLFFFPSCPRSFVLVVHWMR